MYFGNMGTVVPGGPGFTRTAARPGTSTRLQTDMMLRTPIMKMAGNKTVIKPADERARLAQEAILGKQSQSRLQVDGGADMALSVPQDDGKIFGVDKKYILIGGAAIVGLLLFKKSGALGESVTLIPAGGRPPGVRSGSTTRRCRELLLQHKLGVSNAKQQARRERCAWSRG